MNTIRMYAILVKASVRSRMQYKFNFWFSSLLAFVINTMEFLLVALLLYRFGSIKGWSLHEIGYLYAVITLSKAIYRTLANDVHHLEKYLVTGDLDQLLLRPVPILLALMSQNFRIMMGEYIQGGVVLVWAISVLMASGQLTWWVVPQTAAVILTGAVILFSIGFGTATCGFWLTRLSELQNLTEDAAHFSVKYPLELYPKWLQGILLTIVPVGVANYLPSLYVLRDEYGAWLLAGTAGFAIFFLWLMMKFWMFGLSRYQSTGS
ncbi:ABC transporter permease [Paenibacillus hamazuiensis]|uniref:ABC transporter permease n=1 Tax=Paenibacillus hamazuiensis TaxID=2936508 RepID=UPI00200F2577|nr:ABC-2 family transporter protein [Paenibacillus hamazuiensis]